MILGMMMLGSDEDQYKTMFKRGQAAAQLAHISALEGAVLTSDEQHLLEDLVSGNITWQEYLKTCLDAAHVAQTV